MRSEFGAVLSAVLGVQLDVLKTWVLVKGGNGPWQARKGRPESGLFFCSLEKLLQGATK